MRGLLEEYPPYHLKRNRGPQGEQGIQGIQGDIGLTGPQGERGDPFLYEHFTEDHLSKLIGPRGHKGDKGDRGDRGEKGDKWNLTEVTKDEVDFIQKAMGDVVTPAELSKTLGEFRNDITSRLINMITRDALSTHAGGGEVNFLGLDDIAEAIENRIGSDREITIVYDTLTKDVKATVGTSSATGGAENFLGLDDVVAAIQDRAEDGSELILTYNSDNQQLTIQTRDITGGEV